MPFNSEKIKHYFNIAFKVFNQNKEFGATTQKVHDLIGLEFGVFSSKAIEKYYAEMIQAHFLKVSSNGIKAPVDIQQQWNEFMSTGGGS